MPPSIVQNPDRSPLTLFREGLESGGITINPATGPAARAFPPRLPLSGEPALPLARSGTVYSVTRVETRVDIYRLALIDLDGGGRLLARLRGEGAPDETIGQKVTLVSARREGEPPLTFALASEGAGHE